MKKLVSLLLALVLALSLCTFTASADDEITLKFLINAGFYDLDSDLGWEVCERVAGYKIEYEVVNGTEQLMLIIASGTPYDYVYLTKDNYNLMMSEGALMDITDLLSEYGSNITDAISLWDATTQDGRIYAIPSTVAQPNSLNTSIVARKDLLTKAGITEYPTTLDGFHDMLVTLKSAYPDMVPLSVSQTYFIANIASAFGITGDWQDIDGVVTPIVNNPNLPAYMAYVAKLYAEELIDVEMPALTANDMRSKWSSGKAVMLYTAWSGIETPIGALRQLEPSMEYDVLPLLQDENGKVHAEVKYGCTAYAGIPVTSEHPAEAIQAINNMIQKDNFTEIVLGQEGKHYTHNDDGTYSLIQPAFNDEKNNSNVFISGFYRDDYPIMWEARLTKNADLQWVFYAYKDSLLDGGIISPVALAPAVTVVDNKSTMDNYVKDTLISIVAGTKSIDELPKLQEYWSKNGGDTVTEFYNEWYASRK